MTGRLVLAIISTLIEEAAIVAIVRWGLPQINIHIPLWGLIVVMAVWLTYSVTIYRKGSQALRQKQMVGLPDMIGTKGKVVSPLAPEGLVKIKGELWIARLASGEMESGGEIIVVEQDRLKLVVRAKSATDDLEKTE